jgi:hypothetical protein
LERVERVPFFFKFQISSKNLAFSHHTQPHAKGFGQTTTFDTAAETWACPIMVQLLMHRQFEAPNSTLHCFGPQQMENEEEELGPAGAVSGALADVARPPGRPGKHADQTDDLANETNETNKRKRQTRQTRQAR